MRRLSQDEGDAIVSSDYINSYQLTADTEVQVTVPEYATKVVFTFTDNVWVKINTSATAITVPAASITNGSSPELNPTIRQVHYDATTPDKIHLISSADCVAVLAFYK